MADIEHLKRIIKIEFSDIAQKGDTSIEITGDFF
jgi:hypothetical protein